MKRAVFLIILGLGFACLCAASLAFAQSVGGTCSPNGQTFTIGSTNPTQTLVCNSGTWAVAEQIGNSSGTSSYIGIGTSSTPQAQLDINGGLRVGNGSAASCPSTGGVISYWNTKLSYCNGSSGWQTLNTAGAVSACASPSTGFCALQSGDYCSASQTGYITVPANCSVTFYAWGGGGGGGNYYSSSFIGQAGGGGGASFITLGPNGSGSNDYYYLNVGKGGGGGDTANPAAGGAGAYIGGNGDTTYTGGGGGASAVTIGSASGGTVVIVAGGGGGGGADNGSTYKDAVAGRPGGLNTNPNGTSTTGAVGGGSTVGGGGGGYPYGGANEYGGYSYIPIGTTTINSVTINGAGTASGRGTVPGSPYAGVNCLSSCYPTCSSGTCYLPSSAGQGGAGGTSGAGSNGNAGAIFWRIY